MPATFRVHGGAVKPADVVTWIGWYAATLLQPLLEAALAPAARRLLAFSYRRPVVSAGAFGYRSEPRACSGKPFRVFGIGGGMETCSGDTASCGCRVIDG